MHNLMSSNQLGSWNIKDSSFKVTTNQGNLERINDYYECLIEAGSEQSKRICKELMLE